MTELTRNGNDIGVVGDQHAGNRMTERMRIDMRQAMPSAEFIEPRGDAVRVHDLSVIPREQETFVILSPITVQLAQLLLLYTIFTQQRDAFI